MMRKPRLVLTLMMAGMLSAAAFAQESATLTLRSGERISGELVDLGGSGFVMRANGQDRQIPTGDVAAVEFVGGSPSGDVISRLSAGQQVVVLRSGQVVEGRLSDIGGTHPLRLSVDTPSGQRDFSSSDVAQVYLATPPGTPAAAASAAPPAAAVGTAGQAVPAAISIPANQQWVDTGITVRRGDRIAFNASGEITVAPGANAGPGGNTSVAHGNYPVPSAAVGALIGKVGNGSPFAIGANAAAMAMPANGRLYIGVNDDYYGDNSGNFAVSVIRQ
jgi:hypothetical protein